MRAGRLLVAAVVLSVTAALDAVSEVPEDASVPTYDVCDVWKISASAVGSRISVIGYVAQDIEFSYVYRKTCGTVVRLDYGPQSPSLGDCYIGVAAPRCGGLKRNPQLAVVVGVLRSRASDPATHYPQSPPVPAVLTVERFYVPTHQPHRNGI